MDKIRNSYQVQSPFDKDFALKDQFYQLKIKNQPQKQQNNFE